MEKLKEYKYIILIIGLVVLGFAFYWFQIRPAQIIKNCMAKYPMAFEIFTETKDYRIVPYDIFKRNSSISTDKGGYQKCLREHGLK